MLYIAGEEIKNDISPVYLALKMTRKVITEDNNIKRGNITRSKAKTLATSAILSTGSPRMRTRFILNTYLRRTYKYNSFLLPSAEPIYLVDREVIKEMVQVPLKRKETGVRPAAINTLMAIFRLI